MTAQQIPLVDDLELGDDPRLVADAWTSCGARFVGRRNACASCEATEFLIPNGKTAIPTSGEVRACTIVSFAAPGTPARRGRRR